MKNKNMKYNFKLDKLRAISALAVVMIHTSAAIGGNLDYGIKYSLIGTFFNVICRFAVPIFFAISGVLLLEKRITNYSEFYKNRFIKVVIPFIIWCLFYEILSIIYLNKTLTVESFMKNIITNNIYYHLWFYYDLISIYVIVPILSEIVHKIDLKVIKNILIIWAIFNSIKIFLNLFFGIQLAFSNMFIMNNLGYFLLGYYLNKCCIESVKLKTFVFAFTLGFLFTYIIILWGMFYKNSRADLFYSGNSPFVLLMTISMFGIAYTSKDYLINITKLIAKNSLGIYLIHPAVITILKQNNLTIDNFSKYYGILLYFFIILIISLILSICIKKIPILKKILP